MDLPLAREEARRARRAFERKPATLGGGERHSDGVVGERVAAALGEAQPHRIIVPVEAKIELGEVALAMTQRQSVILIKSKGGLPAPAARKNADATDGSSCRREKSRASLVRGNIAPSGTSSGSRSRGAASSAISPAACHVSA